ncbi:MAG: transposase [Thiomicrorhabdus sp.]|nr:transposase [Thiomicrorhabdus sp.]
MSVVMYHEYVNSGIELTLDKYFDCSAIDELYQIYDVNFDGIFENSKNRQFLFSDRTSCHRWRPNQFRLLLSGQVYTLVNGFSRRGLQAAELKSAQVNTIRLKLFKVAAVVISNTRRLRFMLHSRYPVPGTI